MGLVEEYLEVHAQWRELGRRKAELEEWLAGIDDPRITVTSVTRRTFQPSKTVAERLTKDQLVEALPLRVNWKVTGLRAAGVDPDDVTEKIETYFRVTPKDA